MPRLARICCLVLLTVAWVLPASAFSLLGPKQAYQTDANGFDRLVQTDYPFNVWLIHNAEWSYAPQNLGEEYRWSTPVLYYAYDPGFVDYFASNGLFAVDSAVSVLNGLQNADDYSSDLSEVPLDEMRVNYSGSALHLFDLKSAALEMLLIRLGLTDPEYFAWIIRTRQLIPPLACPFYDYTILQRNFDPVSLQPSTYVNGVRYTYQILQTCPPDVLGDYANPYEYVVEPRFVYLSSVASSKITFPHVAYYGNYHVGLTRDDVGGLRYLYSTNNLNLEQAPPDAVLYQTNNLSHLLVPTNLTVLADQSLTNNDAIFTALYPNLVILSSTNYFVNVPVTNLTAFFTNSPYSPAGTPPQLVLGTNVTYQVQTLFKRTFANLFSFQFINGAWTAVPVGDISSVLGPVYQTVQTVAVTNSPYSIPGSPPRTNTYSQTILTNLALGEYFILPTNLCSFSVIAAQITNIVFTTNQILSVTNISSSTNASGSNFVQSYTVNLVTYFTNHTFVVYDVNCVASTIAVRQGLKKISFVRHDYDSLLSRFFTPVTNYYNMVAVTNNHLVTQQFQRVATRPDIVFAAADVPIGGNVQVETVEHFSPATQVAFNQTTVAPTLGGPGTIEGPVTLTFNKVGPIRFNSATEFLDEQSSIFFFNWATFDGTTNAPIVYPVGTDIQQLQQLILIQVSPTAVSPATNGASYSVTLSASGGTAPYTWSMGPSSPALPPGLYMNSDSYHAYIQGIPQQPGAFTFWIRVTDSGGRYVDQYYLLTIN